MNFYRQILDKLEKDGPVDMIVTEEEYGYLHRQMRAIWRQEFWSKDRECPLVLAFFRGYTFYRELSENDNAFWDDFCQHLQVERPNNDIYDNLYKAFQSHYSIKDLFRYDGRGRAFVNTIDEIWGIRSLKADELVKGFIRYYREYPGERVTPDLLQGVLPNADEVATRQAASFDHVFRTMTIVVDTILENDLAISNIEWLEAQLTSYGIDLGTPNPLRFFYNKAQYSVARILQELRFQRTPKQFAAYLGKLARHCRVRLPDGKTDYAYKLAESPQNLVYGRYYVDLEEEQKHHVTPSARVSLNVIEKLPDRVFRTIGSISLYRAPQPFSVDEHGRQSQSIPVYIGGRCHYLWAGSVVRGRALWVDGRAHPDAVGTEVGTAVRLEPEHARVTANLTLSTFFPHHDDPLQLRIGGDTTSLEPITHRSRHVTPVGASVIEAFLDGERIASWQPRDRLFTTSGVEIEATDLDAAPSELYLLTASPPSPHNAELTPLGEPRTLQGERTLWHVRWLNSEPLRLNAWTIQRPQKSLGHRKSSGHKKHRRAKLRLLDNFFWHNEPVRLEAADHELPLSASVRLDGTRYPIVGGEIDFGVLPTGRYRPEIVDRGNVVGGLEPFTVLPEIIVSDSNDSVRFENHSYTLEFALADGRFDRIVYRPFRNDDGTVGVQTRTVDLDDDLSFRCTIEANCIAARFFYRDFSMPAKMVTSFSDAHPLRLVSYAMTSRRQKRLRLSSASAFTTTDPRTYVDIQPNETILLGELSFASVDELICSVLEDGRNDTWQRLASIPVRITPDVGRLQFDGYEGRLWVTPLRDLDIRITVSNARECLREIRLGVADQDQHGTFRFRLPVRTYLQPLTIRASVLARSLTEPIVREEAYRPDFEINDYLRLGLAWSSLRR